MNRNTTFTIKRLLDITVAAATLAVTLPAQGAIAILIRVTMGSPVLFRQLRPGKDGRLFTILKFRTMRDTHANGPLRRDEDRITPLGQFLRSSSLDELPTLWNVVKGDMSLVGPRPLLPEYLERYTPEQARRHDVRPGMTGLAQVNGRNNIDWNTRLALDVHYVDHCTLRLDLQILSRTVLAVLRREGISASGHATMPPFLGNQPPGTQEGET